MTRLEKLFVVTFLVGLVLTVPIQRPTIDREGYWRNISLWSLFAPPVEGSWRTGAVKSIQMGSVSLSNVQTSTTAPITGVVVANSYVEWLGTVAATPQGKYALSSVSLTSTTTVTGAVNFADGSGTNTPRFCVTEYYSNIVASAPQEFALVFVTGNTAATQQTITSVSTTRTKFVYRGSMTDNATQNLNSNMGNMVQTNATKIDGTRAASTGTLTQYYTAVEMR